MARKDALRRFTRTRIAFAAVLLTPAFGTGPNARADTELISGDEVARRINARDDGASFTSSITMELTDRRHKTRVREVRTVRQDSDGQRQTLFVFDEPKDVRGTGLLIHDYGQTPREDDQYLYLPATRKVRRIASGDRGGYFMGTDLSYEDMKNGGKVAIADFHWKTLRREPLGETPCYVVEATAVSADVADELGYSRVTLWVDESIWLVRKVEIADPDGRPLKTIRSSDVRQVEGIWTAQRVEVEHHQTGHRTVLALHDLRYSFASPPDLFSERTLERGFQLSE